MDKLGSPGKQANNLAKKLYPHLKKIKTKKEFAEMIQMVLDEELTATFKAVDNELFGWMTPEQRRDAGV